MSSAHYVMIGGFLGAGKTTAVGRFATWLGDQGKRVGLITNDQGSQLVDSLTLRSRGFAVEEISGGCFCCRFASLKDAADKLTSETKPDVFIAEPVGSCTDLVATVTYPLRRLYGNDFTVAPLSVLVDPQRAMRVLGVTTDEGKRFSDKVLYIYRKQLEEADVIVINKRDLLDEAQFAALDAALASGFPRARRFAMCARSGEGMDAWFAYMTGARQGAGTAMGVDYDTYAEGEAMLGWFNATVAIAAGSGIDGNALTMHLMDAVHRGLGGAEVAHLKTTLSPEDGSGEIATANLVAGDRLAELAQSLSDDITEGQLVINLRAEADPVTLQRAVEQALKDASTAFPGVMLRLEHREAFKPGRPVPTHRITTIASPGSA
jgi:Ni2+-binding GTPase involved in maturation of urease and hydrogenase